MKKYYETLTLLAELAGEYVEDTYTVIDSALGFIPFKNNENKVEEVGIAFHEIARWLLDESEINFDKYMNELS